MRLLKAVPMGSCCHPQDHFYPTGLSSSGRDCYLGMLCYGAWQPLESPGQVSKREFHWALAGFYVIVYWPSNVGKCFCYPIAIADIGF